MDDMDWTLLWLNLGWCVCAIAITAIALYG